MGGKRPDQYQIDPREAGATDYKNLPQTSQGNSALDDTVELDRQRLAESRAELDQDPGGRVPAPGSRPKPSAIPENARREHDTDSDSQKENPLA